MTLTDLNFVAAQWSPCMLRSCGQGALAVAVVWGICRLFPRLPPSARALLWWLACLKTVLGLFVTGPLPLAVLPADAPPPAVVAPIENKSQKSAPQVMASVMATLPDDANSEMTLSAADTETPSRLESLSPVSVALCLWLIGVSFLLVSACLELRTVRRIARLAGACDDLTAAREVGRAIGLSRTPPVLVSERADCSLVIGPWRPTVVLCRADVERLSSEELRALLAHELSHVRRQDLWAGVLPNLARLLFFFNPLVWLACREYDLAREAACDAEALRVSGLAPADYGRLLLKLSLPSAPISRRSGMIALGAASPHGLLLRRRLRGLNGLGSGSLSLSRGASVLALMLAVVALSLHPVRVGAKTVVEAGYAKLPPLPVNSDRPDSTVIPTAPALTRRGWHEKPGKGVVRDPAAVAWPIAVTISAPTALLSSAKGKTPPLSVTSPSDSDNTKEDQPMSKPSPVSNMRKPKFSAALAVAALSAAGSAPLITPAAAQEVPVPPAVPAPPVVAVPAPIAVPAVVAVPAIEPVSAQESRYQYTLRQGDSYSSHTRDKAVGSAQRELAKAQPGDCLVVDRDGKRYLITDAATLRRVKENYAPVDAIGKQMEAKGKEMEEGAGKQMEALGKQMEEVGSRMEALGKQMEEQGELLEAAFEQEKPEAERKAIQEKINALQEQMKAPQEEMRALSEKMKAEAAKMRPMGDQMREYGAKIRVAVKEAEERMTGILDDAFKNNLAVEQKTP